MKNIFNLIKIFFILPFRNDINLPTTLFTKEDFDTVLNHFLGEFYEMKVEETDGMINLTITNKLPFYKNRFQKMINIIEERKMVIISVNYK